MPNHCENDLRVAGTPELLQAFAEFARGPEGAAGDRVQMLSANRFIPYPEEFAINKYTCTKCGHIFTLDSTDLSTTCPRCGGYTQDGYNSGGYKWCVEHWGTKWGLYDVELTCEGPGEVCYTFLSAWSPPAPVIRAMSRRFPSLEFELFYYEGGGGFQGQVYFAAGEETYSWEGAYSGERGG